MKKIVIIGAGPAGLTAAYKLLKENKEYQVMVIEEQKQVGGISRTVNYKGNRIDVGGHRFFTKCLEVENLWKEILPVQGKNSIDDRVFKVSKKLSKGGPDPNKEDRVFLLRNRISRIFYENKFYDYPISVNLKTIKNLGFIRTLKCGFSYIKSRLFPNKENNLEDFYINRFGKKLYSLFFKNYTEKVWGRSPSNISKEWGYQRVKGISVSAVLKNYLLKIFNIKDKNKETSLIESYYYPKYGPGQLYEVMADEIKKMGGVIKTNSKVVRIFKKDNKIESLVYVSDGIEHSEKVDIVMSSMPLKDFVSAINDVPSKIKSIASGLPYRDFITVGILVNKLSLKNETAIKTFNNNIPDCWLYIQDSQVKLGRIQIFNNWSPYMVKDVKNTVWLGLEYFCSENDDFWNLSDKEIKKLAIEELIKIKVIDSKVLDSCCIRVKKAYPAYFDTYKDIDKLKKYLDNINNLYCIGRNGQHRYNNMDHSMMTAIKAIDVINKRADKDDIWNVNVDDKYQEVKG